jgi:IS1 family transposase/transposase-like protein
MLVWGLAHHYQLRAMIFLTMAWGLAHHYQAKAGTRRISQNDSPPSEPVPADHSQASLPEPAVPQKKRAAAGEFAGVTRLPACAECEAAKKITAVAPGAPPPVIRSTRGRPKTIKPEGQYCPNPKCRYYGWLKRGNLSSNGHPNGGPQRQWACSVCDEYFMESYGTIFYRKRVPAKEISRAITALAEGLGIRAVGRIFEVAPETVLRWLVETEPHLLAFNRYWVRELQIEQVQLDELYGVIRAYQTGALTEAEAITALDHPDPDEAMVSSAPPPPAQSLWLWTAIDPVSKFWLAAVVGDRGAAQAGQIVHQVVGRLKAGVTPLFLTDGNRAYEQPILSHFSEQREPGEGQRKPRWFPLPDLLYAQVIKKRRGRRLVSVSKRVVFGSLTQINEKLQLHGWGINTAFIERLNLTIRQLVPGLGRRVNTLPHSPERLSQQVGLVQTYYNFCLPCRSLALAPVAGQAGQSRTPAMAVGVTDRRWTLSEVLWFKPPPFPQAI